MTDEKELALSADKIWQGIAFLMTATTAGVSWLFKRHVTRVDDQGERIEDLEKQMAKKVSHDDLQLMMESIRNEIREQGREETRRIDQVLTQMAGQK